MSTVKSPEKLSALKNGKEDKIVSEKTQSEELPLGWTVEVKTRKGDSGKKVDRYYTDPITKYTFRSLREVQRYLKTGQLGRLAIKPKDNNCVDIDLDKKSSEPENGPEGHRKRANSGEKSMSESSHRASKRLATVKPDAPPSPPERKTRQATKLAGIKTDEPPSVPEAKTRQATKLAGIKADAPPSSPEAETCQATKLAGIKADAPSPPEAETCQATKLAGIKPDAPPSAPEAKTRQATKLAEVKADALPSSPEAETCQATKLAGVKAEAPPSPPEAETRQATKLAGVKADTPPSPPEAETCQATKLPGVKADAPPSPPEAKTRQATKLTGVKADAQPLPPEAKTRQATKLAGIKTGASPPPERKTRQATKLAGVKSDAPLPPLSPPEPKTRKAKRLAGVEVDAPPGLPPSPPEPKTRRKTVALLEKEPETKTIIANKAKEEEKSDQISLSEPTDNSGNTDMDILASSVAATLPPDQPPPAAAPPATFAGNPSVINPISQDQTIADIKPESPMNFSLNDLWTDPCIEFAVKTLTGAIPFGDLNNSGNFPASPPLEVPLEELWTDPCIEFAVKTLTGAIPVTGELSVQDYLQNQPTCSSDMNNFCQTEVLSKHFETAAVHNNSHSNSNNTNNKLPETVIPVVRNGGLQVSGNGVLPQQVKGGNNIGQCSTRPRFYQ